MVFALSDTCRVRELVGSTLLVAMANPGKWRYPSSDRHVLGLVLFVRKELEFLL
jgi:hypothetical protein